MFTDGASVARSSGCPRPKALEARAAWLVGRRLALASGLPHGSRASHSRRRNGCRKKAQGEFNDRDGKRSPRGVVARKADRVICSRTGRSGSSTTSWAGPPNPRARAPNCPSTASAPNNGRVSPRPELDRSVRRRTWRSKTAARRCAVCFRDGIGQRCSPTPSSALVETSTAIATGSSPKPDDVYRCEACSFAAVSRKDYVGEV